jgi:integrase/recombinase XerD
MNEITISSTALQQAQRIPEDAFSRYVAFLDASPKTVETYTRATRQLLAYFSLKGIQQPTREDILAFRDELTATGHKPSTVQNYIVAARLFFAWLEQEGLYPNIAAHLKGAKLDKAHKKDYLTSKQVKAVLNDIERDTLTGKRDYAILVLMITGGLRTIEVSRANIEDLRTLGDDSVLYVQGKGHTEKTDFVKLDAHVEAAIRDYLKARSAADLKEPLFTSTSNNSRGGRLSTRTVSGIVKERMQEAGYDSDKLTAHSLRHTAVTLSLLAGKPLEEVQQFARHANMQTTLIYAHSLDKAKNTCSSAIAKAIF